MDLNWLKKIGYRFQKRALVLMYHNIDTVLSDPWELAVSPKNFEEQLQVLKKYRVVPASQLAEEVRVGKVISKTIALSFDDGYEDNFSNAKPLLEKYQCPATFFISHHFIDSREAYWWDELAWLILESDSLPENLSLDIAGQDLYFYLGVDAELSPEKLAAQHKWVWHRRPPTKRAELYLELWKMLKPLPHAEIRKELDKLSRWGGGVGAARRIAMSAEQLFTLKDHSLIDTGIHTMTHPSLSRHTYEFQQDEIRKSDESLVQSGFHHSLIAFPYGDFNDDTQRIVTELKLRAAFTTSEKVITKTSNPCTLGRFQVRNIDGVAFEKQLRRWFAEFPAS